jgi:adenylyltransferase/sulfurtransferase
LYPDEKSTAANCEDAGVIGTSVGIIGMLQANEVIKMIVETGTVLTGKIVVYNILNNEQQKYDFDKSDVLLMNKEIFDKKYGIEENQIEEVNFEFVLDEINDVEVLFLDVRNEVEFPKINFKNGIQIPLMNLENEMEKLDKSQTIYVFCQSGIRSKIAAQLLQKHQFKNIKNIVGGAFAMKQLLQEKFTI